MIKLFLLHPNFKDTGIEPEGQNYYCPHCAMIEGILHYYPHLRNALDIVYVNFQRPRHEIIELVGEENQGCPLLILSDTKKIKGDIGTFKTYGSLFFSNSKYEIASFLGGQFEIALPHP